MPAIASPLFGQVAQSVADYSIEFRTLAAESGWKDTALQEAFYRGLQDQLKDELATCDDSASLDLFICTSIRLDNHLRERRRERRPRPSNFSSQAQTFSESTARLPPPTPVLSPRSWVEPD